MATNPDGTAGAARRPVVGRSLATLVGVTLGGFAALLLVALYALSPASTPTFREPGPMAALPPVTANAAATDRGPAVGPAVGPAAPPSAVRRLLTAPRAVPSTASARQEAPRSAPVTFGRQFQVAPKAHDAPRVAGPQRGPGPGGTVAGGAVTVEGTLVAAVGPTVAASAPGRPTLPNGPANASPGTPVVIPGPGPATSRDGAPAAPVLPRIPRGAPAFRPVVAASGSDSGSGSRSGSGSEQRPAARGGKDSKHGGDHAVKPPRKRVDKPSGRHDRGGDRPAGRLATTRSGGSGERADVGRDRGGKHGRDGARRHDAAARDDD